MTIELFYVMSLIFIFGLAIGSFLNVVILRYETHTTILGRSNCPVCKKTLRWYELIPLFSYIAQRGMCRGCSTRLSVQYPLVELSTGIVFMLVYITQIPLDTAYIYLVLILDFLTWSLFIVIAVYDMRTKRIPDLFSFLLGSITFLALFVGLDGFVLPEISHLIAGPVLFLPFYILWKVSNGRWLGLGDGKLAISIGWLLGLSQGISAVMFAFWIGAAASLIYIGVGKIQNGATHLTLKSEIPFGPYLVLGTALAYFFSLNLFTYLL